MTRQKTITVNGESMRIIARRQGEKEYAVSVNEKQYTLTCLSFAEAMAKAQAQFLHERRAIMATKKKMAKTDSKLSHAAARQKTPKGARGAKTTDEAPKDATAAPERDTAQEGAPQAKNTSLLDEAIAVLTATGQPMNAQEMIEAILAKGEWATKGKTPGSTLYASIIREIKNKGDAARFVKTERGKFALKS